MQTDDGSRIIGRNAYGFSITHSRTLRASIQCIPNPTPPEGAEVFGVVAVPVLGHQLVAVRRRASGTLEFPGGRLEAGETVEQASRREVHEECGGVVGSVRLFAHQRLEYDDGRVRYLACVLCRLTELGQMPANNETEGRVVAPLEGLLAQGLTGRWGNVHIREFAGLANLALRDGGEE